MWELHNNTRYSAERGWVRDRDGAEVWIVAVKGTFSILPDGTTELADKQEPVCQVPVYQDEAGTSSMRYDTDLVHKKPGTDVLVGGFAYARRPFQDTQVDVSVRLGTVNKTLRVVGDRRWIQDLGSPQMTAPEPFDRIPVAYEHAFGGVDKQLPTEAPDRGDTRNPVGTGFISTERNADNVQVPNVEYPDSLIRNWKDRPDPAGLGPISPNWTSRLRYAGTYDDEWLRTRFPLVPKDFDDRYYCSGPEDQRVAGFLQGGELASLHNLTATGQLEFAIPRVVLGFRTKFGSEVVHHRADLHTVIVEPEVPRVMLVWHTHLRCHHKVHQLLSTIVNEKQVLSPAFKSGSDRAAA